MSDPIEEIRERPAVTVSGSLNLWMKGEVNPFIRLEPEERDTLLSEIDRLRAILALTEQHKTEAEQERDTFLAEIDRLRVENTKLREFFETVFSDLWDLQGDGFDLQDTAERLGLIVRVPADEAFRDEWGADEMYVWIWNPLATEALKGGGK